MNIPKKSDKKEMVQGIVWSLLALIVSIPVLMAIFGSSDNESSNTTNTSTTQVSEPTPTIKQEVQNINTSPSLSVSEYEARMSSEGIRLSEAGNYLSQASRLCKEGMTQSEYDQCIEVLNQASMSFTNVNYVFKAQTNPPAKYIEFNKNMIQILDGMIEAVDSMSFAMGFEDFATVNKENATIEKLTAQMDEEFTKISL